MTATIEGLDQEECSWQEGRKGGSAVENRNLRHNVGELDLHKNSNYLNNCAGLTCQLEALTLSGRPHSEGRIIPGGTTPVLNNSDTNQLFLATKFHYQTLLNIHPATPLLHHNN